MIITSMQWCSFWPGVESTCAFACVHVCGQSACVDLLLLQELVQHQHGLDEEAQAVLHNNSLAVRMTSSPLSRKALTEARRKAEASFIPVVCPLTLPPVLSQAVEGPMHAWLLPMLHSVGWLA